MEKKGIDISRWQGDFNLAQAKDEGVEFVIIKAAGGDAGLYKDGQFENNYKKAKDLGMPCGCYFYSKAMNVEEAKKEAEYFLNVIKDKQFELPVFFDIEDRTQRAQGKRVLTDIIKTQCDYMEAHEYYVGIYSSESFFVSEMYNDELERYDHWVANWSRKPKINMGIWQNSSSNIVCGQRVDTDTMYKDYSVIKEKGFNGFGKKVEEPKEEEKKEDNTMVVTEDAVDLAIKVCIGEFGNGAERKEKLGDRYNEVQSIVNAYFKMKDVLEG